MAALPSDLSLTNIADGAPIVAADHRNNYTAIQTFGNDLNDLLAGGSAGQVLTSGGASAVSWGAGGQKVAAVGTNYSALAQVIWPTANAAILVPFTLQTAQTLAAIRVVAGNAQTGNFDVGVYDSVGNRKVSKGSTAQSTLTGSAVNTVSVTSTPLSAGQYYLALAADNTTGKFCFESPGAFVTGLSAFDQLQVATSFPLPATITPGSTHPTSGIVLTAPVT